MHTENDVIARIRRTRDRNDLRGPRLRERVEAHRLERESPLVDDAHLDECRAGLRQGHVTQARAPRDCAQHRRFVRSFQRRGEVRDRCPGSDRPTSRAHLVPPENRVHRLRTRVANARVRVHSGASWEVCVKCARAWG